MGARGDMGHTGQKVQESGTYECRDGTAVTYVAGEVFRECPVTGQATVWKKGRESGSAPGDRH
jgi:hypothetical protein